jgi:hypothetical protein
MIPTKTFPSNAFFSNETLAESPMNSREKSPNGRRAIRLGEPRAESQGTCLFDRRGRSCRGRVDR